MTNVKEITDWFISFQCLLLLLSLQFGIFPKTFGTHAQTMYDFISNTFGWLFLLIIFILDIFLISLVASRYGRFKLGDDNEEPEFSFMSWLGMLFSRLGVGIVFWGVAEPLTHYLHSPFPGKVPDQSPESARLAMGYTFSLGNLTMVYFAMGLSSHTFNSVKTRWFNFYCYGTCLR